MRIVYLIIAHKNPEQVIRLVNRLDDEDVHFFIHVDVRANSVYSRVRAALKDLSSCHFVKRMHGTWGTFDLDRILLACIESLSASGLTYDFAIKLSGQDYPLVSNAEIKQTLAGCAGKQLLRHAPLPISLWHDGGWYRIKRYHFIFGNRVMVYPPFKIENPIEAVGTRILSLFLEKEREIPHG